MSAEAESALLQRRHTRNKKFFFFYRLKQDLRTYKRHYQRLVLLLTNGGLHTAGPTHVIQQGHAALLQGAVR